MGTASNIGARALHKQAGALHLFLATNASTAVAASAACDAPTAAACQNITCQTLPSAAASAAMMGAVDAAFIRCLAAIAACDADARAPHALAIAG